MTDVFTKEKRSEVMSLIRSKGTGIEETFRRCLDANKLSGYVANPKMLSNPDFIFGKYEIAIFCDGDFWHGKDYIKIKKRLKKKFWRNKIETNIARDFKNTKKLESEGWLVLRFWESEINNNAQECVARVKRALDKRRHVANYKFMP